MILKKVNMKEDLFEKLKYAPKDELESYLITAYITGSMSAVIGVLTILLTLIFTNIFTVICSFIVLHTFGNVAIASDNIKAYIRSLLVLKHSDK